MRWKTIQCKQKDKPFTAIWIPKKFVYETQAIQENSIIRKNNGKFKRIRAHGECLGIRSRRRTRQAAISCGELQISFDPQISEWGNPHDEESWNVTWIHSVAWGTRGTETSKYPEEKKSTEIPRVVASESGGGETVCSNIYGVWTAMWNCEGVVEWRGKVSQSRWEPFRRNAVTS